MLFYAALVVAGVIAAAVVVWIARSMMVAGQSAYRSMSPAKASGKSARLAHLNSNRSATPSPWGWSGQSGAAVAGGLNPARVREAPVTRSKSKDWSELELYQRSYEKAARERNTEPATSGSVRNVLTGYDMNRPTSPDTSSWPYQDGYKPELSESATQEVSAAAERPTKPWGW